VHGGVSSACVVTVAKTKLSGRLAAKENLEL